MKVGLADVKAEIEVGLVDVRFHLVKVNIFYTVGEAKCFLGTCTHV